MSQTRPTDRSVDEENNRQDEGESKSREGTSREGVNNTVDNKATEQGGFSTSETSTTSDNKFSINETADTTESAKFDENDRAELEEKLGKDLADNVHFVDEDTEVSHADVRRFKRAGVEGGFNPRTNKIYLVVESIKANEVLTRQERLAWVATHELAHAGVKTQFSTLLNNVLTNARSHFLVKGIADKIKKDRGDRGLPISDMVATEEALVELYAAVKTGKWEELESRYGIKIHESWRNGEKSVQPLLERVATILKRLMSRVIGRPITDEEVFTILSGIEKGIDTYAKSGRDVQRVKFDNANKFSLNPNKKVEPIKAKKIVFKDRESAKTWAKENITGTFRNKETSERITVSNRSIEKFLSGKAIEKTGDFAKHTEILTAVPKIIEQAKLGAIESDKNGNIDIKDVQKFYAMVGNNAVKLTVKRYNDKNVGSKAYSYEVKEIETLDGIRWADAEKTTPALPSSVSVGSLIKNFDNVNNDDIRFSVNRPKKESLEKLRKAEDVEISGNEIPLTDDVKQNKRNALEYGKTIAGNSYRNNDTGDSLNLRVSGIKEILNHDYKDKEHLQSIAAIPQIIKNAVYIDSRPNEDKNKRPDIDNYHYFVTGLNIGGENYVVRSVMAEVKNGDAYYDHKLSKIGKGELLSLPSRITTPVGDNAALIGINDKRLLSILQDNESNFDEENDIRFSTSGQKQSAADLAKSGKAVQDDGLFEMLKTKDGRKALFKKWTGALDEHITDALRPVNDWMEDSLASVIGRPEMKRLQNNKSFEIVKTSPTTVTTNL